LAVTVFSFPPDKGNVGTAAYLNVFGSIYRVLQACPFCEELHAYLECILSILLDFSRQAAWLILLVKRPYMMQEETGKALQQALLMWDAL
jgi:hypothetical protein